MVDFINLFILINTCHARTQIGFILEKMKWNDITSLHLEISSQCNAACPLCARYPTSSLYEHPSITMDQVWTIEQVRARLPTADLVNIEKFLINGTLGDFITNRDALEIVQHFSAASPIAKIEINTNGSAGILEKFGTDKKC